MTFLNWSYLYRVNWEEKIATIHSAQVKNESVSIADQADDYTSEEMTRHQYILMYSILMGVATYVYIHRTFAFFAMCLRASINLHDKIFRGITRATMFFFNNNPSGRILNRFSKDISSIDTILPPALIDCLAVSRIEINCDLLFIFFSCSPVLFRISSHRGDCCDCQLLAADTHTGHELSFLHNSTLFHQHVQKC